MFERDYFGWTIWTGLFTGDYGWAKGHEIENPEEFEPDQIGWAYLYSKLQNALEEAGLKGKLGTCFHTSSEVPRILRDFGYVEEFHKATQNYISNPEVHFDFGLHSSFSQGEYILQGKFDQVLSNDIEMLKILKFGNILVEHPIHPEKNNRTSDMVERLTTEPIISMIETNDVILSWENMPGYSREKTYFSSLKHLCEFRNELSDKLQEIGKKELINKHLFCLDTGHLLIWRHSQQDYNQADKEIEEYLPQIAKYTNVFHFHCNDGVVDNHLTPGIYDFANDSSRQWINKQRFMENSEIIWNWIRICEENKNIKGRHLHLEAGTTPFKLSSYIDFGKKLADIL